MSALSIQPTYPIFTDIDGQPLEDGFVWIGQANLDPQVNPINVYWDAALTISAPQPIRTLGGYPSRNGTPARLYVNSDYSIRVMNRNGSTVYSAPTATERYNSGVISSINAVQVDYDPAGLGAVQTNVQAKLRETVSVKDFGAMGNGITDDRAAIQAAVDAVRASGGGIVFFPEGRYLINSTVSPDSITNGIVVPFNTANGLDDRVLLEGEGRASVLLAGSNNMVLVRYADSHGGVSKLTFDGNGRTGVYGLGVMPEDLTQTTTNVYTIYNVFEQLYMVNLAEAVYMTFGPVVAGSDSGCYYNRYDNIMVYSCLRGFYAPTRSASFGGGVGRNLFSNIRVGQNCNTGFQMEAGGTNTLLHCNFEGISQGTSPNTTPTAIILTGVGNDSNYFVGCHIESCTRDILLDTTYTYWSGGSFDPAKCVFTQPFRMLAADGFSTMGAFTYTAAVGISNFAFTDLNYTSPQYAMRFNGTAVKIINTAQYHKISNTGAGFLSQSAEYHELVGNGGVSTLVVTSGAASQSGAGGNVISIFNTAQGTNGTLYGGDDGVTRVYRVRSDGNVYNTNGVYAAISDIKFKQDISDAKSQWNDIKSLRFRKYRLKSDPTGKLQLGLIAQEAEEVSPGLVDEAKDYDRVEVPVLDAEGKQVVNDKNEPQYKVEYVETGTVTKSVKYSILYMKAVAALQEAMTRIEALESEVQKLKGAA